MPRWRRRGVLQVRNLNINFMGARWIFLGLSAVLIVVSLGSLALRGLQFGIEFQGGTIVSIADGQGKAIDEVRAAFTDAGMPDVSVQTAVTEGVDGFLVKTTETQATVAGEKSEAAAATLGMNAAEFSISTIGSGWGEKLTTAALAALGLSILAILIYIAFRFEYKMSVMAVVALIHDLLITLGIYSIIGAEVSTATIAALLTIVGYSLYDTVVVFSRMKENADKVVKTTFMDMANASLNEVFVRTMNTSITSLIPVITMLVFNVEALNGFAIALVIGLTIGVYSSVGVASPLYTMWKEREPKYAKLRQKYGAA